VTAGEVVAGILYGGTTGYISGGPVEAVREAVSLSSTVGMVVVQAVDAGYEASQAGKDWDEVLQTGAWEGLKGFVFAKGMEYGAARVFGKGGKGGKGPTEPPVRSPQTVAQAVSAREYQRSIGAGSKLAQDFRKAQLALAEARKAGASAQEIARLEEALRKKAWEVNSSYGAKVALRKGGNNPVAREFERQQRALNQEVDRAFEKEVGENFSYEEWTPDGWKRRELKWEDIRNASSTGFNIDRDKALVEKSLWRRGKDGKLYPVKENWILHPDGSPKMPRYRLVNKQGQRVTMAKFNKDAQEIYNNTYRRVSGGHDPEAAFQTITSSANTEAYRNKDWINDLSNAENVARLEGTGAKSAAEVARGKGYHGPAAGVNAVTKNVEVARAGGKEINKRLINILKAKGADASTIKYWEEMADALQRYSSDPVGGYHKLQQMAGGKTIPQVMDDIATALEGSIQFGR
jgi:hypothetical protein